MFGHDSKLDLAFLNVKHRVGDIALLEHVLIPVEFQYVLSRAHFGKKVFGVKHVLVLLLHGSLLRLDQFHPSLARRTATASVVKIAPSKRNRLASEFSNFGKVQSKCTNCV